MQRIHITSTGKFVLHETISALGLTKVNSVSSDRVINVTQVDLEYNKFYSPDLGDWHHNYVAATMIEPLSRG